MYSNTDKLNRGTNAATMMAATSRHSTTAATIVICVDVAFQSSPVLTVASVPLQRAQRQVTAAVLGSANGVKDTVPPAPPMPVNVLAARLAFVALARTWPSLYKTLIRVSC